MKRATLAVAAIAARPLAPTVARRPDVELELRAAPATVSLRSGPATPVWAYSAKLLSGPAATVKAVSQSYAGPILRFEQGQRVRIHLVNELPEPTIVHWHGLDVPEAADGHPRLAVGRGQRYVYEFDVINRAGTYWYHPHPHMRTAAQVMQGLAGVILVSDPVEARHALPSGPEEIVCVVQDRVLDASNQIAYTSAMSTGMMGMPVEMMTGFLGDRILVNGRVPEPLSLGTRAYRVRLLNGSNARVYKLAWSDERPVTVIGTDGGLLERPVARPYVTLGPGERVDTILDLSDQAVGSRLTLSSRPFPESLFDMPMGGRGRGMGRGRRGTPGDTAAGHAPANGTAMPVLTVSIDRRERGRFDVPQQLSTYEQAWQPPPGVPTRRVPIDFRMMRFFLNGRQFDMADVAADETVRAGSTHIWEIDNSAPSSGRMMDHMRMGHPIHLHGRQFRVLRRQVAPEWAPAWRALSDGFVDEGWKDTVLVLPGERVQLLVRFSSFPGLYLYHCHNLEHEDMGMMRNFRIV